MNAPSRCHRHRYFFFHSRSFLIASSSFSESTLIHIAFKPYQVPYNVVVCVIIKIVVVVFVVISIGIGIVILILGSVG